MITGSEIALHVDALTARGPRHSGNRAGVRAALEHVTAFLDGLGHEVVTFRYGPDPSDVNLLAGPPDATLEIGAHWDSVAGSPGADDNASGVAGLLAVARALAERGQDQVSGPAVRFCVFGGEEYGFEGSRAHVAHLDPEVEGSIILEMIGYRAEEQQIPPALAWLPDLPTRGDFIAAIADAGSAPYAAAFGDACAAEGLPVYPLVAPPDMRIPDLVRSDHAPYWAAGRRSLLLTDTAEYRNPHYHRRTDTPDTLDLDFAAMVARAVVTTAGMLAA